MIGRKKSKPAAQGAAAKQLAEGKKPRSRRAIKQQAAGHPSVVRPSMGPRPAITQRAQKRRPRRGNSRRAGRAGAGAAPAAPTRPLSGGFHTRALMRAWRQFQGGSLSHWITILVIGLSLTIYGAFALLLTNAETLLQTWRGDNMVTVFLEPGLGADKAEMVREHLAAHALIREVNTVDPKEAVLRLKEMLGTEAGLLDELGEDPLPFSLEFTLDKGNLHHASELARQINTWPGIEAVSYDQAWAERLEALLKTFRFSALVLSGLLLSAVALIISNTIKLTIIARRDEVEVMQFMGATDAFIKTPFIYEGIMQGILGALLALSLTALLHMGAAEAVQEMGTAFGVHLSLHFLPWTHLALIAGLGGGLGLIGALISVSRFLDL